MLGRGAQRAGGLGRLTRGRAGFAGADAMAAGFAGFVLAMLADDLLDCDAEMLEDSTVDTRALGTCANNGKSMVDEIVASDKIVASHVVASMGNEMDNESEHEFDGIPV